jgi:hypothetical protein
MRRHGLAVDNLRSCEVVTADGEVLLASRQRHPELFWGLRGGGGTSAGRIAGGLHFRHSMLDGERLGRRVARHVTHRHFQARCQRSGSRP